MTCSTSTADVRLRTFLAILSNIWRGVWKFPRNSSPISIFVSTNISVLMDNTEPLADMLLPTSMEVHCNATKIWEVGPKERQTRDAQKKAWNVNVRKERH